jgi:tRNA modification GTPase
MNASFSTLDTIVAIATPDGRGGIGVVRLAGPDAPRIASALLARDEPLQPRHATLARIVDAAETSRSIDQVVATWFAAPHSYTGDEVVEISGHGSPLLLRRIVELAMRHGARLAEPGEFTLRAYLNGRIDLIQAEAVADLVSAVTPLQARAAMDQIEGTLTSAIGKVDASLFDLAARLEASLDFPDEGFHFITREDLSRELSRITGTLEGLARDGRRGRVIREGRLVVITGPPNAGKSSLFNSLLGTSRAIVTEIPGTTRDVLTDQVDIAGIPVTLADTAGLRDVTDVVEAEGVARARQAREIAALTVVVVDRAVPLGDRERRILNETTSPRLVVANKIDLPAAWTPADVHAIVPGEVVEVSATTRQGLDCLRRAVAAQLGAESGVDRDPPAISNVRHLTLVEQSLQSAERALEQLDAGATEEVILIELIAARQTLEELTGKRTPDDVLRHIFATFCVGK